MDYVRLFYYILPAYFANSSPVFFRGKTPLDGNRKLWDGNPILGKNKTLRGTLFGLAAGFTIGLTLSILAPDVFFQGYPFASKIAASALLSAGGVFGDLLGSFAKRRFSLKPGESVPVLDQSLFFISSVAFASPIYVPRIDEFTFLLGLTLVLHVVSNVIAHRLNLKRVPW